MRFAAQFASRCLRCAVCVVLSALHCAALRCAARIAFCFCSRWIGIGLSLLRIGRIKKNTLLAGYAALQHIAPGRQVAMTIQVGDELS
jgi:hypothetical protein